MPSSQATEKDRLHYRLESGLLKAARTRLEALGACVLHVHGDAFQEKAIDLIICYRTKYVGIELKVGNNKATAHQEVFLQRIRNAGGIGITAWTVADCLVPLQMIDREITSTAPMLYH